MRSVTFRRPDDYHVHLRDNSILPIVVPITAKFFGRAMVMPNLVPPITSLVQVKQYRDLIAKFVPEGTQFQPLMTIFMTEKTNPKELANWFEDGAVFAVKLYPSSATTNTECGVTSFERINHLLEVMERYDIPLLVHAEVTEDDVDIFDKEARFVDTVFPSILSRFPSLRIVMEHVTTKEGLDLIRLNQERMAGTVTAHHLVYDRTDMFSSGFRPHLWCLPVLKDRSHRDVLRNAVTSGERYLMLGTDSAPHFRSKKESSLCSAGVFSSLTAIPAYLKVFAEEGALHNFERFACLNGAKFHRLQLSGHYVTWSEKPHRVPKSISVKDREELIPLFAGEEMSWSCIS